MIKPILSLIIIVFSLGFGFFYSKPAYTSIQSARNDLKKLDQTAQSVSEIKKIIAETGKSLSEVDPDGLARFDVFLPETLDGVRFANNLQQIGAANMIILSEIKVEQKENGKKQDKSAGSQAANAGAVGKVLTIDKNLAENNSASAKAGTGSGEKYVATKASFTFAATYSGFLLFLNDLEKSLGLINITSLSFEELATSEEEKSSQKDMPPLYQFSVEIETYSLK